MRYVESLNDAVGHHQIFQTFSKNEIMSFFWNLLQVYLYY